MVDFYRCANCQQEFEKTLNEEEAYQQAKENFGKTPDEIPMELVCDDCYRKIMKWLRTKVACAKHGRN